MNSSNQGNSQGNIQDGSTSSGAMQSDQSRQNFVLVDAEPVVDGIDDGYILGEVRRVDRVRSRRNAETGQHDADA
ncbi:hypothetical protein AAKU55_001955 [Oxalobacteraceae bacterium GrIS 1.11]